MKLNYINKENKYKTIKEVLKNHFHISDRLLLKLKKKRQIFLNGLAAEPYFMINLNDIITVDISFNEKSENIIPKNIPLDIVFEDEALLIINKPSGFPVHPSMAHFEDSLSNGVQYYFDKNNIHSKIHPVTRLDKDTSGLVIFAKNEYVQSCLSFQMSNNTFEKYYLAILCGNLENSVGTINAPIARKSGSIIEREINSNGQIAITHYKLIKNYIDFCLVEFKLETGRTHQIRIHSKYIGHPILGDTLYGKASDLINRQALHCYKIKFVHPVTNIEMEFIVDLPQDIKI